jgi:O-antigen/teichoic acid export membrane protein
VSRSRRVIEGLGANYLSFAFTGIIRFFVIPFYLTHLGPELMGLRSFIRETLEYLQFSDLGVKTSVAAIIAKEFQPGCSEDQKDSLVKVLRSGAQIQQLFAILALCFTLIFALNLGAFVKGLARNNMSMGQLCVAIFGLSFSLYIASGVYSGILIGKQLMAKNSLYSLFGSAVAAILGVFLVYIGWSLYGVAVASLVAAIYVFIHLRWRTAKLGVRLQLFRGPIEWGSMARLVKLSGWILLASLGGMLSLHSSRIVLGVTPGLGMSAVNQFALLVAVPLLLRQQANRFSVILRPGLTQLYHTGSGGEKTRRLGCLLLRSTGVMAATAFVGIWLINGSFVTRWVGAQYYAGDLPNLLVAVLFALTIWTFGFKVLLEVRFEFRRRGFAFVCSGVATVILALVLVRRFGLSGVIMAGILGEMLIILPFVVGHVSSWLFSDQGWLAGFFKVTWMPSLLITCGIVARWKIIHRLSSWPEVVLSALLVGSICLLGGGIWLWPDLRQYSVFRLVHERFSLVEEGQS